MRRIVLNARQARLLRDHLTGNHDYDYLDLMRLDNLAKKLTELQGAYGEKMAELARDEKKLRRRGLRGEPIQDALLAMQYDVEELNDEAETVEVVLSVEDGDYKLIRDKLDSVQRWVATDDLRPTILGMLKAVTEAESEGPVALHPSVKAAK